MTSCVLTVLGDPVSAARVGREQTFRKVRQIQCRVKMVQGVGREQTALCPIAAILHDIKARNKEFSPPQSPEKGDKGRICPPKRGAVLAGAQPRTMCIAAVAGEGIWLSPQCCALELPAT